MRRVQWMRGNGHQLTQGCGRQAGVAVQRDDVLNAVGQLHPVGKIKRAVVWCVGFVTCGN